MIKLQASGFEALAKEAHTSNLRLLKTLIISVKVLLIFANY